jgi:hypothetical protein
MAGSYDASCTLALRRIKTSRRRKNVGNVGNGSKKVTVQKCDDANVWNKQSVDAIRALWALREIPGNYQGIECQLNIIESV